MNDTYCLKRQASVENQLTSDKSAPHTPAAVTESSETSDAILITSPEPASTDSVFRGRKQHHMSVTMTKTKVLRP